ncbi:hypothetical protein TO66_09390 [Pseudomonas sp. MRSN 12121]|nr:hypothetical protein TO66_09390 [Pseudomonas sp. MRSN 12121]
MNRSAIVGSGWSGRAYSGAKLLALANMLLRSIFTEGNMVLNHCLPFSRNFGPQHLTGGIAPGCENQLCMLTRPFRPGDS